MSPGAKRIAVDQALGEAEGLVEHIELQSGGACAARCLLSGDGLTTAVQGEPATFYCQAVDVYGNPATRGNERFELRAKRQEETKDRSGAVHLSKKLVEFPIKHEVIDEGGGMYRCTYTLKHPGRARLFWWLLPRGDLTPRSNSDKDDETSSHAGTSVHDGGSVYSKSSKSSKSTATVVVDNAHDAQLDGLVKETTVLVRPMVPDTVAGTQADEQALALIKEHAISQVAHQAEASGEGLSTARAGETAYFTVRLPEKPSRVRSGKPETGLQSKWEAAEASAIEDSKIHVWATIKRAPGAAAAKHGVKDFKVLDIRDNGDNSYLVSYSARATGKMQMHVELEGGAPIMQSPFHVIVHAGPLVPGKCTAEGEGLAECEVGERAAFVIHARDRIANVRHLTKEYLEATGSSPDIFDVKVGPARTLCAALRTFVASVPLNGMVANP